jgi:hypothetical protein
MTSLLLRGCSEEEVRAFKRLQSGYVDMQGDVFSPEELARLRFWRWMHQSHQLSVISYQFAGRGNVGDQGDVVSQRADD